jgi:UDP:flavonoid glycosyltransferase YjiC (YdhE family)
MIETLPAYRDAFLQVDQPIDLVITSTFALGAAAMAEATKIPRLTLHMQPICLRSEYDCPLFLPEFSWLSGSPRWVKRLFFRFVDFTLDRLARAPVNAFRSQLGLPPFRQFYEEAVHGAQGIAALFPAWFATPQPDWPKNLRQFSFPITLDPKPLPAELETWLAAGPPPVLWTHGSANFDVRHFQSRALATSEKIGARCLLVSLDSPAAPLPPGAFHISHVRFEDLFPRCAAIVHHGGIGTTAKAIASGVPQLIIPRSHDQPDNAHRIVRLGLGKTLAYRQLDTPRLATTVQELLKSPAIKTRCQEYQSRLLATDSLPALCDWAESLAQREEKESTTEDTERTEGRHDS